VSVRPSAWIACAHAAGDISSGRLAMPAKVQKEGASAADSVRKPGRLEVERVGFIAGSFSITKETNVRV
ncbi:hypothetical protein, partial [Methyloversatilis sp.]|uniref:hypothetical protein n=1 Tax=Methyloversatilis sp. TaxID=2569862 RepID=UPI003F700578